MVLLCLLFLASSASAQFKAASPSCELNDSPAVSPIDETALAIRSIESLRKLEKLVPVHASRGAFEADPRLSSVPLEVFEKEFETVFAEVEPLLCRLRQKTLKMQIVNALHSYRDGLFWLNRIDQRRVIHVAALSFRATQTPPDAAYSSTIPYTVAIHWRHASKYLKRAQALIPDSKGR